ncbi:threonine/serine exporter family protein [Alkalibacter mobilis]|uniref:threonine/serine ThrE exporter family protein n=1 Tax=Alkalibacter mobilis TaxID=2787712 RepID=UPI00189DE789|nr:threonine/serine exporter family protein [Alkalibacter mobilis]MBF7096253.1 threonine/serine exporter family protein [Alkalibacter mobilis]
MDVAINSTLEANQKLLTYIMDLGEILLKSGAEVNRVEDTVTRIGKAYGFCRVDVFSITSSIVVSAHDPQGDVFTETRRITRYITDLDKIERVNRLSRKICAKPLDETELLEAIDQIKNAEGYSETAMFFTYGLISAAFSIFFGGTFNDGITAFLCGLVLRVVLRLGRKMDLQNIVINFFTSAAVGIGAIVMIKMGLGQNMDKIIIGNIMLLIPGILLTTSLRDMINGDLVTGIMGLGDAILRSLAISFGFAVVMAWFGGGII